MTGQGAEHALVVDDHTARWISRAYRSMASLSGAEETQSLARQQRCSCARCTIASKTISDHLRFWTYRPALRRSPHCRDVHGRPKPRHLDGHP
jgi:hypothetical protein